MIEDYINKILDPYGITCCYYSGDGNTSKVISPPSVCYFGKVKFISSHFCFVRLELLCLIIFYLN